MCANRINRIALIVGLLCLVLAGCQPLTTLPTLDASPIPLGSSTPVPLFTTTSLPESDPLLLPTAEEIPQDSATQAFSPAPPDTPTLEPQNIRIAVIGDYGSGEQAEQDVANLVLSWNPDFIITTGDNNYPDGAAETIDEHIGKYYHSYIHPYEGAFGEGADQNRFFPTLGNHDWRSVNASPYLEYFSLPGNERYYDVDLGFVHLFALDSDSNEPDGVGASSQQGLWLQEKLQSSDASWKIVYMHHPPYSSGTHGPVGWTRWPYAQWGASTVISGHDHTYERIHADGIPHFVNGLGGGAIYRFENIVEGSQVRYNGDYGAMLIEAFPDQLNFQFITRYGELIDSFSLINSP